MGFRERKEQTPDLGAHGLKETRASGVALLAAQGFWAPREIRVFPKKSMPGSGSGAVGAARNTRPLKLAQEERAPQSLPVTRVGSAITCCVPVVYQDTMHFQTARIWSPRCGRIN